ncbi:MAG: hypothetical protein P1U88_05615 [Thalassobaculaceae bacterium]|nr:hypothetical protein [Thalassobaculaceae bacterium]
MIDEARGIEVSYDQIVYVTVHGPYNLGVTGQRRLGCLAEIVLTMWSEPWAERKLLELLTDLRERLQSEPSEGEAMDPLGLPRQTAGPDDRATKWGWLLGSASSIGGY